MASILLSRPNKLAFPGGRPGINPAHPMSRNCILAAVPGAGNNFVNTVNGSPGTVNNGSATLVRKTYSWFGPAIDFGIASNTTDTIAFPGIYKSGNGLTMAGITTLATTPTGQYFLNDASGGNNALGVFIGGSNDNIDLNLTSTVQGPSIGAIAGPYNVPYFFAASVDAGGFINCIVVKNLATGKVAFTNITAASNPPAVGDGTLLIGNRGAAREWPGAIAAVAYSNTFLNLQQLLQWADDPWSFWYPQRIGLAELLRPPPPSGPTGTLAATEAPDVAAFAGNIAVVGTLATTEAADVAAFAGTAGVNGILAATEAADVAAFTGAGAVSGTLATTEAADVAAFAGAVSILGTLATTEAADIAAFAGSFSGVVTGTLAATEAPDAAAFAGTVTGLPVGIFVAQELPDTMIFAVSYKGLPTAPSPYPSPLDYGWYNSEPDVWIDRGRPGGGTQD